MRKPVVDYRKFRFSKLGTPEFSHLNLLFGWIGYFVLYTITELFIPQEKCFVVHSSLDDVIPFCEYFIVPYVLWYLSLAVTLVYFALYNVENFKRFQIFVITSQVIAMAVYIIFPNRQDLRTDLDALGRDNFFIDVVRLLRTVDTNTNVCPSLHVGLSIGIASMWLKEKTAAWWVRIAIVIFCILVILSTVFLKQHSVVDAYAAIPMCILAEFLSSGKYWKEKLKKKKV